MQKHLMPTIIVVDDDQQMRTWLRQILESKGYRVQEASDGYEALASIERSEPSLMVVDIGLPKFSGLDIIMHLRSHHHAVKVLAISGQILDGLSSNSKCNTTSPNGLRCCHANTKVYPLECRRA